jgi:hypothetical protein
MPAVAFQRLAHDLRADGIAALTGEGAGSRDRSQVNRRWFEPAHYRWGGDSHSTNFKDGSCAGIDKHSGGPTRMY